MRVIDWYELNILHHDGVWDRWGESVGQVLMNWAFEEVYGDPDILRIQHHLYRGLRELLERVS